MAPPQPCSISAAHNLRRHLVLLFTIAVLTGRAATTDTAAPAPSTSDSESAAASSFLRSRCATTLYPALCYDSLLPYASEFQTSHARLARVASGVAAARLLALSAKVKDYILHQHEPAEGRSSGRPSETAALRDCASTISAAAKLAKRSEADLNGLDDAAQTQARWAVSNAKTWLSAAMTNEGMCADGLEEAGAQASPAGKEVTAGVVSVKQYTSNALALVNGIQL